MNNSISVEDLPEEIQEMVELTNQQLQPINPSDGIEQFLNSKSTKVIDKTIDEYSRKLEQFQQFCAMRDINNLNHLNGRTINAYRQWRRTESVNRSEPLAAKTLRDDMYLLREFLGFLESIEGVSQGLSDKVEIPSLNRGEGVRNVNLDSDRVKTILDYLNQYQYASREHVVWLFFTQLGRRPGGLYALDLEDLYLDCEDPYIEFKHRPPETTLKNKSKSEGEIAIFEPTTTVFEDYIAKTRIDVTTESGREPFLTSQDGRLSKTSMRRYVYAYSRPCTIGKECPHGRDPDSCEATRPSASTSKCPSSRPPYALRHGYITDNLHRGFPKRLLSERCDTSEKMIDKHYDERNAEEKRNLRKEILEELQDEDSEGGYL